MLAKHKDLECSGDMAAMLHSGFENLERKFRGALTPMPVVQPSGQAWLFLVGQDWLRYIFICCLQNPGNVFKDFSTGPG